MLGSLATIKMLLAHCKHDHEEGEPERGWQHLLEPSSERGTGGCCKITSCRDPSSVDVVETLMLEYECTVAQVRLWCVARLQRAKVLRQRRCV